MKRFIGFFILILVSLLLAIFLAIHIKNLLEQKNSKFLSGIFNFEGKWSFNFRLKEEGGNPIEELISKDLKEQDGHFAIVVESLSEDKKNTNYYLNNFEPFPAGSLYKLFLLSVTLRLQEQGLLPDDKVINGSRKHLKDVLGFEDFGYEDAGDEISYTVSEIMKRIAEISDNYAAIMLAEEIGWDKVREEAKILGADSTTIKSPITTTASDMALFFKKLYKKEVVSPSASEKLINLLSDSQLNNRIPAKLPKELKIAHKTGELPQIRHDAGIVFLDNNPYLIVLMSQNLTYEDTAIELLANISKDIYTYFSNIKTSVE